MKRKEINLALLVDNRQPAQRQKQQYNYRQQDQFSRPQQSWPQQPWQQQQPHRSATTDVFSQPAPSSPLKATATEPPTGRHKPVNLALLIDRPKTTTSSKLERVTDTSTLASTASQQRATPIGEALSTAEDALVADNYAYGTRVKYSLPFFQIAGLRSLSEMPRVFQTPEEVHSWCDIPKSLAAIRPNTLRCFNGNQLLFPGITFLEEPHEYWLAEETYNRIKQSAESARADGGGNGATGNKWNHHRFHGSVTKVAGKCFSPFIEADSIGCIQGGKNYNSPDYEYYQMTAVQISNQFLAANLLGTLLHYMIELFFNGYGSCIPPQLKEKAWVQFEQFYIREIEGKYVPYLTELRVYDLHYDLAGSIDGAFVECNEWLAARRENRPPRLTLFDWKRTKRFDSKAFTGEMAAPPLQCFPDTNLYKYTIQLNLYKRIIETNSPYTVDAMYLCRFHPSSETYEMRPVEVYAQEIDALLALRKAELDVGNAVAAAAGTTIVAEADVVK